MDKLLINGKIATLDQKKQEFQAVGVDKDHIIALGDESELRKLAGSATEIIDLDGGVLFPGLIDSHTHLMIYAYLLDGLDLAPSRVKKIDDIVRSVKRAVEKHKSGEWIRGSRFVDYNLAENRYPTRYDLDPVSSDNPVILYHTSFHACVLNSCAMAALDVTSESEPPMGGIIEKDSDTGEPTGVLHDAAMMDIAFNRLFSSDLQNMTTDTRVAMCSRAMAKFAEVGIVAVADALVTPVSLSVYQETLKAGKAKVRVYAMPEYTVSQDLIKSGIRSGFGNDLLKIGPIKIFEDGGMSNRTAAVKIPYRCKPFGAGLKTLTREELFAIVKRIHSLGFQIAVHCQGDDGLTDLLDAFESVLGARSTNPLRHRIEHAGCLYPELLARAAAMNIGISSQPVFFSFLGDGFIEAFGQESAHSLYPFKSMIQSGIHLGGSSDCPVSPNDPRLGLVGAVMRQSASGQTIGPQECLTMVEALRMFTFESAWLAFDEKIAGTIEIGKRADFTVFADDPRYMPVENVQHLPVKMTVLGGELTYFQPR